MPLTHWQAWLGVACGGALGACGRYAVAVLLVVPDARWPLATLLVNLCGCFVAGFVTAWLSRHGTLIGVGHLMLTVGFLGAFTTFSAFSVETLRLFEAGKAGLALANAAGNLVGALVAVALGTLLARAL